MHEAPGIELLFPYRGGCACVYVCVGGLNGCSGMRLDVKFPRFRILLWAHHHIGNNPALVSIAIVANVEVLLDFGFVAHPEDCVELASSWSRSHCRCALAIEMSVVLMKLNLKTCSYKLL